MLQKQQVVDWGGGMKGFLPAYKWQNNGVVGLENLGAGARGGRGGVHVFPKTI